MTLYGTVHTGCFLLFEIIAGQWKWKNCLYRHSDLFYYSVLCLCSSEEQTGTEQLGHLRTCSFYKGVVSVILHLQCTKAFYVFLCWQLVGLCASYWGFSLQCSCLLPQGILDILGWDCKWICSLIYLICNILSSLFLCKCEITFCLEMLSVFHIKLFELHFMWSKCVIKIMFIIITIIIIIIIWHYNAWEQAALFLMVMAILHKRTYRVDNIRVYWC